ncbi:DUF2637 domain-containing protein [Rhodococcus sp. 06-156-3C]|uniref:DUF2637 domain-containing protein n=1 Tax=Nocardiaceae TaxID=85025 RepID=UPI000522F444|nr:MULTISPECIES: DUF2637 domain-containing protein [Rhodococcus]OZD13001.1 DUF2637 domain-containing protein [Rhodococcus sp. 06-156-4a]OZD17870.1 DUF2637 domain-containing protein [Rhodococcus sp. 06-156-3C]OZD20595.1 DUF2637 domain-containing protein [Rhodococcus sp. 06-156-4C]OZD30686.1 DUF2637 domain-containing protein [Rhodococcus sp. 06-156-3b]OZD32540.1 DUF2637 domain-containing protein [Rhodococcus sp. 06-156-3]
MSRRHHANPPSTLSNSDGVAIHPGILQWALATAVALTVGIAGASFWLSFAVLRDLAVMAGIGEYEAWVIPVVLDGAIVSTTVTAIALSNHTDEGTVRGRRFVVSIMRVAATASIAGNSYHAVLSSTLLPAVVSAGIATIAPIALLAMTEVLAVILRAPRGVAKPEAAPSALSDESDWTRLEAGQHGERLDDEPQAEHVVGQSAESPSGHTDALAPEVAETVRLRHAHREWSWARIGKETDGSVASTAMRRYRKWEETNAGGANASGYGQFEFDDEPSTEPNRILVE